MKNLVLVTALLLLSIAGQSAFASNSNLQSLRCLNGSPYAFDAVLDSSNFEVGSGYVSVNQANVFFNYSSARLICEGNRPGELSCIGYWQASGPRDIAQLDTSIDKNGVIRATFKTAKVYGRKTITVECKLKDMK